MFLYKTIYNFDLINGIYKVCVYWFTFGVYTKGMIQVSKSWEKLTGAFHVTDEPNLGTFIVCNKKRLSFNTQPMRLSERWWCTCSILTTRFPWSNDSNSFILRLDRDLFDLVWSFVCKYKGILKGADSTKVTTSVPQLCVCCHTVMTVNSTSNTRRCPVEATVLHCYSTTKLVSVSCA